MSDAQTVGLLLLAVSLVLAPQVGRRLDERYRRKAERAAAIRRHPSVTSRGDRGKGAPR